MQTQGKLIPLLILILGMALYPLVAYTQQKNKRPEPIIIRVGVVNVSTYAHTLERYEKAFATLSKLDQRFRFQFAVGAYDDVLEWHGDGFIDIAIMTPGMVGTLLSAEKLSDAEGELKDSASKALDKLYICSAPAPVASKDNKIAVESRKDDSKAPFFEYHAACVVRNGSPYNWTEIEKKAKEGKVKFLFVNPPSASGFILPEAILRNHGIDPRGHIEWANTHGQALDLLLDTHDDKTGQMKVAFVADSSFNPSANYPREYFDQFLKVDNFPCLDEISIPPDVVLFSSGFMTRNKDKKYLEEIRALFLHESLRKTFSEDKQWRDRFENTLVKWVIDLQHKGETQLLAHKLFDQHLTLEQIVAKLRFHEKERPGKTRLALVLSGGGAKCAYQLGVIEAIEAELAKFRKDDKPVDINLVVGTSGGAINALCAALGLTSDPKAGQQALRETWVSFKQKDFFVPWTPMPVTLGLIIGLIQALFIILAVRLCDKEPIRWFKYTRVIILVLLFFTILLPVIGWTSWTPFPLCLIMVIVWIQLFDRRAANQPVINEESVNRWRVPTGIVMIAAGIVEYLIASKEWMLWESMSVAILLGSVIPLLLLIVMALRLFTERWQGRGWKLAMGSLLLLILFESTLLIFWRDARAWVNQLGRDHLLHHIWLALTMNLSISALCLLSIGSLMLLAEWRRISETTICTKSMAFLLRFQQERIRLHRLPQSIKGFLKSCGMFFKNNTGDLRAFIQFLEQNTNSRRPVLTFIILLLVSLMTIQIWLSLFSDKSLSNSSGIDAALAEKFPKLLANLNADIKPPQGFNDRDQLKYISSEIIGRGLLKRDLVITTSKIESKLEDTESALPSNTNQIIRKQPPSSDSDIYFYYDFASDGPDNIPPPDESFTPDQRFRSFKSNKEILLDIVIGSTSIFPVFDPRQPEHSDDSVKDKRISSLQLIDGGFAHNSPIEAAALWKPTHIILIEASPKEVPFAGPDLLDNSMAAFNYLFSQAQLVDASYRGEVEIYSLQPRTATGNEDANLCTFDFSNLLMEGAMDTGLNDALNVENPRFRRERAHPVFLSFD